MILYKEPILLMLKTKLKHIKMFKTLKGKTFFYEQFVFHKKRMKLKLNLKAYTYSYGTSESF